MTLLITTATYRAARGAYRRLRPIGDFILQAGWWRGSVTKLSPVALSGRGRRRLT